MIPSQTPPNRRARPWDRVSWWYSLLLVVPVIGFILTFAFSQGGDNGLSGVVKDAYTGKPVSGAIISTANVTATTAKNGSFSVDDSTATTLTVSRDDYVSTQIAVAPDTGKIEVELRPTAISGTITDKKSGKPLSGVVVMVTGAGGQSVSAITDADGKYVIDNVPDGGTLVVRYEDAIVASSTLGKNAQFDFEIRPDVLTGTITDESGAPLAGVTVAIGGASAKTDSAGRYRIPGVPSSGDITVSKPGFIEQTAKLPDSLKFDASLKQFRINALYATTSVVGNDQAWNQLLVTADQTAVNAIVIDLKDSDGKVHFDTQHALAGQIGAKTVDFDVRKRLQELRDHDLYAIGRIVVFEDPLLAKGKPDLAIHDSTTGGLWTTWDGRVWVNPYQRDVWQYNVDLAVEAAGLGFDEIQVDYLQFPTDGLLSQLDFGAQAANQTRAQAISGFLEQLHTAVKQTGAALSLTVPGATLLNADDGGIGLNLKEIAPFADFICPVLYPSYFAPGELGFDIPNNHPYDVVSQSLRQGASLLPDATLMLRPWLQDFSYGEGVAYGDTEVAAEIQAASEFNGNGWSLWNPKSAYHSGALPHE